MSMFICLARGPHDAALDWPFVNRTIKLSVVDQQANALHKMNEYRYFMTTNTNYWERPVSVWKYRKISNAQF